jgi:methionine salvage enolase-phosphatase E1
MTPVKKKNTDTTFSRCLVCGSVLSEDVRRAKVDEEAIGDLYKGARDRGFTQAQVEYLRSCIGVVWAKSYRAGELAARLFPRSDRTGAVGQ